MNDSHTNSTIPNAERARRRWLVAAAAAAALLVVTPVAAHSGTFGPAFGPAGTQAGGPGYGMSMHGGMHGGAVGRMHGGTFDDMRRGAYGGMDGGMVGGISGVRGGAQGLTALQRYPLGTEVTVQTFAADPTAGAQPVATLTATVGQTSEVAFAEQVQAAMTDASFVTVVTGPRTERVALDAGADLRRAPTAGLMRFGALDQGQTVEIAFFAAQDDTAPSATLTFTYGEDSAVAFHQGIVDAAAEAEVAVVTLPAQERTVDLSATPWSGARDLKGAPGYGTGRGDGMRRDGMGRDGMGSYGMGTYGRRGVPNAPRAD